MLIGTNHHILTSWSCYKPHQPWNKPVWHKSTIDIPIQVSVKSTLMDKHPPLCTPKKMVNVARHNFKYVKIHIFNGYKRRVYRYLLSPAH